MYKASVLATAGLLIVASLFVYAYTRGPDDDGKLKFGQKPFENFEISNVASIVFEANGKEPTELKRDAFYRWQVQGEPAVFPADEMKMRSFFVQLMNMQVGDRIPGGELHPQAFGFPNSGDALPQPIGEAGGRFSLRGEDKKVLFEIHSGKARTIGDGTYVRFGNKPDVYLIAENIAPAYEANYWLEKEIANVDGEGIAAIEFLASKGSSRIERVSAGAPWKEKRFGGASPVLTPRFAKNILPRLTDSLKELRFVQLMPRKSNALLEKYKISTIGIETFSGTYYTVALYRRPGSGPNSSTPFYATFEVRLVSGKDLGKYEAISLVSNVATFNHKNAPWFFALDDASTKRFLVNEP